MESLLRKEKYLLVCVPFDPWSRSLSSLPMPLAEITGTFISPSEIKINNPPAFNLSVDPGEPAERPVYSPAGHNRSTDRPVFRS